MQSGKLTYRMFHGFRQAKFAYSSLILGISQFTQLPQLPLRTKLHLKKGNLTQI
jgi:hypothetical protein